MSLTKTVSILVMLIAWALATSIHAQSESAQQSMLRLTLKTTGSDYCAGDEELDRMDLKVRFVYENRGASPAILYKPSPRPTRILIARNAQEVSDARFEVDASVTWYTTKVSDAENKCYNGSVPSDCFVTIGPGSSYEVEDEVRLFVVRGDVRAIEGAVKSGEHVLQVVVPTWDESAKLAQELERRWRSHGSLWYKSIRSEPLTFTVEKERKVGECK